VIGAAHVFPNQILIASWEGFLFQSTHQGKQSSVIPPPI
jgi:hypothetical protein